MARLPDIQLFSCPACSKLYKRKVDTWIDMSGPWQPSSPAPDVPRICVCGHVFLLSESIIVANLSGTDPNRPSDSSTVGMDELDIPEFLRRRDDDDGDYPRVSRPPAVTISTQKSLIAQWIESLLARFRKPAKPTKNQVVKNVLWEMESTALPERIAPQTDTVPHNRLS